MYLTAHLIMALIIGRLSGNYTAAIIGAFLIDIDHLVPFIRHGDIFNFKKFWQVVAKGKHFYSDPEKYLHSIFAWSAISLLVILINLRFGLILSIAYLSHLFLDFLDGPNYYFFYPFAKIKVKGPVRFLSFGEVVITLGLLGIYLFLLVK